jgi:DNA-binding GntR family transcriptional regulator
MAASDEHSAALAHRIKDQIRELMNRGTFSPGLQLRQTELAERFGVSRVPVREALSLLAAEGFVDHHAERGFFVARLSSDEAKQLYRIRRLLETELLSTVQWPTARQIAGLRRVVAKLEKCATERNEPEWVRLHREFYLDVIELSPQKVLVREVMRLLRHTDRYRSLVHHAMTGNELYASHERNIVDALVDRDRERLLRVFHEDHAYIEDYLQNVLKGRGL